MVVLVCTASLVWAAATVDVVFERIVVDPAGPRAPWAKTHGDIDGDGLPDIVVGGHAGELSLVQRVLRKLGIDTERPRGELVWYRNPTWERHVITTAYPIRTDIEAADLDGDGRQDLVITTDDGLFWLKNPKWTPQQVSERKFHDIEIVDIDGDGRLDIVARNQSLFDYEDGDEILLFRQTAAGDWAARTLSVPHGEGLAVADINQDGLPDIVLGEVWLENPGSVEAAWPTHRYSGDWTWPDVVVQVADVDGDGRPDIVLTPSEPVGERYRLSWFRSPADPTGRWQEHVIDADVETILHALAVEDFDGDGRPDVLTAEMNQGEDPDEVRLYRNPGRSGAWPVKVLAEDGLHNLRAVDIDGDFDIDFFGTNWQREDFRGDYDVRLWLNTTASDPAWTRIVVDDARPGQALFVFAADLDGDGTTEIITGGWIYQQTGDGPHEWVRRPVGSPAENVVAVHDFDGDGAVDLLASGWRGYGHRPSLLERSLYKLGLTSVDPWTKGNEFVWARNDGRGGFEVLTGLPPGSGDFLQGAAVMEDRGQTSVVLSWHQPGTPLESIRVPHPLSAPSELTVLGHTSQNEEVQAGDVDGDGDVDLVLGTIWLENQGNGRWQEHPLAATAGKPDRVRLVDMNGDGKLDVVVGFEAISSPGRLVWYEQPAVPTALWVEHPVAEVIGPMSLGVGDIDGDGDLDLVVGEHNLAHPANARLLWFENLAGDALAWRGHLIHRGDEHHNGALLVDVDNDGDLDIVSIGWGHDDVLVYLNPGAEKRDDMVTFDP